MGLVGLREGFSVGTIAIGELGESDGIKVPTTTFEGTYDGTDVDDGLVGDPVGTGVTLATLVGVGAEVTFDDGELLDIGNSLGVGLSVITIVY